MKKNIKRKKLRPAAGVLRAIDMPEETDGSVLKATLIGHSRALIENHRGVHAYTDSGITLTAAEGMVSICGRDLEITEIDRERMLVRGYIRGITYE